MRASVPASASVARSIALAAVVAALLAGRGGGDAKDAAGPAEPQATATAVEADSGAARRLVRAHLAAVGRNDLDAYMAAVDDDTSFEIGGRAFDGREAVRALFEGELSGGHYDVLSERPSAGGVTVEVNFRRGDLLEELNYAYTVRDGRISEMVGRYR